MCQPWYLKNKPESSFCRSCGSTIHNASFCVGCGDRFCRLNFNCVFNHSTTCDSCGDMWCDRPCCEDDEICWKCNDNDVFRCKYCCFRHHDRDDEEDDEEEEEDEDDYY